MAMLAEPKRKQKFSSDPRNSSWTNDDSKFGHKLMEKMGWSRGKGLGAKEDGNTQHIAVSVKNDHRGVGCSKSYADNWIAHQDDFNALLSSLGEHHADGKTSQEDTEKKVLSLEHKSRLSKGRVHYQKFTKGKDLSARSETDLDCVFGKRKSQSGNTTPQMHYELNSDSEEKTHGFITVTSTDSVQDYFKKKMAEKLGKLTSTTAGSPKLQDEEEEKRNKTSSDDNYEENAENISKKKKKSKNKRKHEYLIEEQSCGVDMPNHEEPVEKKSKKKNSKMEIEVSVSEEKASTVKLNEQCTSSKKSKCKHTSEENQTSVDHDGGNTEDEVPDKPKKKKKSKKQKKKSEEDEGYHQANKEVRFRIGNALNDDSDGQNESEKRELDNKSSRDSTSMKTNKQQKSGKQQHSTDIGTSPVCNPDIVPDLIDSPEGHTGTIINSDSVNTEPSRQVPGRQHPVRGNVRELPAVKAHEESFHGANIKHLRGYVGLHVNECDIQKVLLKKLRSVK